MAKRPPKKAASTVRTAAAEREAVQKSIALAALEKVSKADGCRDHLNPGSHEVEGTFAGEVDGEPFAYKVAGDLHIAPDGASSKSVAAPPEEVLAYCLQYVPKTKRPAILDRLPKLFTENGQAMPECDDERLLTECELLLGKLRSRTQGTKRGTVSFSRRD